MSTAENPKNRPLEPAEIAHLEAKADRERAETLKLDAETREATARASATELLLEREQEKRARELAADEHHHVYVFDQDVNETSVKRCIGQLNAWARQDPGCGIEIQINSPGGSIFDGFALIDFIRDLQAKEHHITMLAYGMAASMGGVLLQVGDERVMGANCLLLIHEGSLGAIGDFGKVEDRVKLMGLMHERILDLFTSRSKVSKAMIKRNWQRRDWWMTADEALKHGFIDAIR
jgi:ATP-dependent Clp protease protease subunit